MDQDDSAAEADRVPWDELTPAWEVEATAATPTWISLADAEFRVGVSRSALRSWFRSGQVPSRLVDSRHGPQRMVSLDAVIDRAQQSPRLQRRAAKALTMEAEVVLLHERLGELERRIADLEAERA
ncbi:MAG: excisionase [Acidimicrobiales bacterium]